MCRPAFTTGLLSEIQRELFTREIDNEALQDLVDYLREFPYVPSSKEPPAMKSVNVTCAPINYEPHDSLVSFVNVVGGWAVSNNLTKTVSKKEQETMYTPEQKKADYLDYRLSDISCTKERALMKEFNLLDDDTPETPKEIVDRILAGKYVLPKEDDEREYWSGENAFGNIKWRDPSVTRDQAGFDKASDLQHKASQKVKDTITIGTPAEGLKALQDFENATFH